MLWGTKFEKLDVWTMHVLDFIPTLAHFDRTNEGIDNKSQSRDKILYILLAFVIYPVMIVAS